MIKVNFNKTVFASLLLCMLSPFAAQADGFKFPSKERIEYQVDSVFRKLSTREKIDFARQQGDAENTEKAGEKGEGWWPYPFGRCLSSGSGEDEPAQQMGQDPYANDH